MRHDSSAPTQSSAQRRKEQSGAIRSNQKQSAVISSNQKHSEALRSQQKPSEAIRSNLKQSTFPELRAATAVVDERAEVDEADRAPVGAHTSEDLVLHVDEKVGACEEDVEEDHLNQSDAIRRDRKPPEAIGGIGGDQTWRRGPPRCPCRCRARCARGRCERGRGGAP